ncbi:MAG: hypothetical protein QG567_832 [Campylobacterota bacterium]|nr:hypothetical protein [Campylobacterota bacterium]
MQEIYLEVINSALNSLNILNYLIFAAAFFILVFFIILAIITRKKAFLFGFFSFFSIFLLFFTPFISYFFTETYLKKRTVTTIETSQLTFINKVAIKAGFENNSNKILKECEVFTFAIEKNDNIVKKIKNIITPKNYTKTSLKASIKPSENEEFYITLNNISDKEAFEIYNLSFCK